MKAADVNGKKLDELREMAKELGIIGIYTMSKEVLTEAILDTIAANAKSANAKAETNANAKAETNANAKAETDNKPDPVQVAKEAFEVADKAVKDARDDLRDTDRGTPERAAARKAIRTAEKIRDEAKTHYRDMKKLKRDEDGGFSWKALAGYTAIIVGSFGAGGLTAMAYDRVSGADSGESGSSIVNGDQL